MTSRLLKTKQEVNLYLGDQSWRCVCWAVEAKIKPEIFSAAIQHSLWIQPVQAEAVQVAL